MPTLAARAVWMALNLSQSPPPSFGYLVTQTDLRPEASLPAAIGGGPPLCFLRYLLFKFLTPSFILQRLIYRCEQHSKNTVFVAEFGIFPRRINFPYIF